MQDLNEIFEEVDKIESDNNNLCPVCGSNLPDDQASTCLVCGFDFDEIFSCPYALNKTVQIGTREPVNLCFCELTRKQCKVKGLDFEICSTFRSLDSINTGE